MPTNKNSFFMQKTFVLTDYLLEVARRWYLCIAIIAISVIVSLVYSVFIVTPMYDSTAKLYVVNKSSETISSSDFSISTYLTNDFSEIIVDRLVLDEVVAELNNKYTFSELRKYLSVNVPSGTRIIEVTARTPNAQDSKNIVDSICRVAQENLAEKIGLDRVTIISEGGLASSPSVPNTHNNVLISFLLAILISMSAVFLIYVTDNKISSATDVEKYLDLNVLATIPYNQSRQKPKTNS